jgi:hypothetical protein
VPFNKLFSEFLHKTNTDTQVRVRAQELMVRRTTLCMHAGPASTGGTHRILQRNVDLLPHRADNRQLIHNVAQDICLLHELENARVKDRTRHALDSFGAHECLEHVAVYVHFLDALADLRHDWYHDVGRTVSDLHVACVITLLRSTVLLRAFRLHFLSWLTYIHEGVHEQ